MIDWLNASSDFGLLRESGADDGGRTPHGRNGTAVGASLGCVTLDNQAAYDRQRKRFLSTKIEANPGANIKYYGTVLLYRPAIAEP